MPTPEKNWTRQALAKIQGTAPIAVAAIVALSLVACGGTAEDPADTADGGNMGASEAMTDTDATSGDDTMAGDEEGADDEETSAEGEIGEPMTSGTMTGSVEFRSPEDGATVSSPVEVCLDTEGATILPAGTVEPGSGHHHILVNPTEEESAIILAGEPIVIPNDATHIHMGDASECTEIDLEPGEHTLLAVLGDHAHTNLNPAVTDELTITVE